MRLKCKHILLSYDKAENSSHDRPLGVAVEDAERLILELKKGDIMLDEAPAKNSSSASGPGTVVILVGLKKKKCTQTLAMQ